MDIFGYSNNTNSIGQVASSEFSRITLGAGITLAQQYQGQYQQQLRPVTSIGDSNVYFLPGRPQGVIQIGMLVGANGIFSAMRNSSQCGQIDNISVDVSGGQCSTSIQPASVVFGGGIVETVSFGLNSGSPEIVESLSLRVASMSIR